MLKVPYFKQDTVYSCGPAALQMIFAFYGKGFSEKALAKKLNTTVSDGTKHQSLINIAKSEGFYVYVNNNSSLKEVHSLLLENIPVMVNFIEPSNDDGHYSVVVAVREDSIVLNDPWNGEGLIMDSSDFVARWCSEDSKNDCWIMAISLEAFNLGKQYNPS